MGLVNTTRSIYKQPDDIEPRPIEDTPDDESSEGDPDREGNTDPGTNCPPAEDVDPAEIRRAALQQAADDINAAALAQAKIDAEPRTVPAQAIKLHAFKYLSIADSEGMFHVTGTDGKGAAFTVTEDAPPNATIDDLLHYIADMSVKYG